MALIKCPECGREVSSIAKACPNCGYPIAENNPVGEVRIKINTGGVTTLTIVDGYGNELWRGRSGSVAVIPVNGPTYISFTGLRNQVSATIKAGERYELGVINGMFVPKYALNKVDVLDSGI